MSEEELRLALQVVTEGARARAPDPIASETFTTETFRRESDRVATRSRPWTLGEGIQGLGVGEKLSRGRATGALALRVYVEAKKPKASVNNPVPRRVAIPELGETPTDVLAIGRVKAELLTDRVRPAMPGCGVGHPDVTVGTFGCLMRRKNGRGAEGDDDLYILSNSHVLADEGCGRPGDPIVQPGIDDGGDPGSDVLAELAEAEPFVFGDTGFENLMDAAIARVLDADDVEGDIRSLGRPPRGVGRVIRRGMEVVKVGRTTDYTVGVVQDIDFRFHMPYKLPGHRSEHFGRPGHTNTGRVGFRDQVLCTRYTDGGDSGAAVLNKRGYLLGLHFAGSPSASVFSPIRPILKAFDIELA